MAAFVAAWPAKDAARLTAYFSDDATYCNGPLPPAHGRVAIEASFASFMEMGGEIDVDIRHLLADGPIVMTERVDYVRTGDATMVLPVMGICEVYDGKITAWRDYFDLGQFTEETVSP